jgi:transcription elongation factor Elf1
MERLLFICPRTGQGIDVGVETELQTLLRIRDNSLSARCSSCGERHEWLVGEAQLLKAA